jgi:hypothetical protein
MGEALDAAAPTAGMDRLAGAIEAMARRVRLRALTMIVRVQVRKVRRPARPRTMTSPARIKQP